MILNKRFFGGFSRIYLNHWEIKNSVLPDKFRELSHIIFSIHFYTQNQLNKNKK
jgi:hypothetical protein